MFVDKHTYKMDPKPIRSDYFNIGLNSKECLKILAGSADKTNKGKAKEDDDMVQIIAGDHSGSIESSKLKDGKLYEHIFKTLPGPNQKVSAIDVTSTGKAFIAVGALAIKGVNRKGKEFFLLELNNLTEPIQHLRVKWPTDIFVSGHYIYHHYSLTSGNTSEGGVVEMTDSYTSPGRIIAMTIIHFDKARKKDSTAVLATEDRLIRILNGSSCAFELETNGIPTSLTLLNLLDKTKAMFLYGSSDGRVTMVSMKYQTNNPSFQWEIPGGDGTSSSPPRAAVEVIAVSNSGKELAVGRSDGSIEVWVFDGSLNLDGSENIDHDVAPVSRFTYNCNESITSLCMSNDSNHLIVCTFSGSIFGLEWKGVVRKHVSKQAVEDAQLRISMLKEECQELEATLTLERAKYLEGTDSNVLSKSRSRDDGAVSALPRFAVKDAFVLQDDASYILTIEVAIPIDVVILQSDVPIDVMDSEKNSAVVSFSGSESQEVLVTFRCQSNTTRLEVKVRTVEGQYGQMRIYIISRVTPKTCQLKVYPIKPLSLHMRGHSSLAKQSEDKSRLEVTGNFDVHELHSWVFSALPEVPDKVSESEPITYTFKSTLSSTYLYTEVSNKKIVFESDNVSTISILKDFITRHATAKGMRIEVSTSIADNAIASALSKLFPLIKRLAASKEFDKLHAAVLELSRTDSAVASELIQDLETDFQDRQHYAMISLDRVLGLITDFVIDEIKLRGKASKSTLNMIRNRVEDLLPAVEAFFGRETPSNNQTQEFVSMMLDFWKSFHS